jgi:acyl-CoA thioesterase FadM
MLLAIEIPSLWLDSFDAIAPAFGLEIHLADADGGDKPPTVARARSDWCRVNRQSIEPVPISPSLLDTLREDRGVLPRNRSLPAISPELRRYRWDHKVLRSELAPSRKVHPRAIMNWVEEAVFNACPQAGWLRERLGEAGISNLQTRHDTEFISLPGAGDSAGIVSRLADARRLKGCWYREISDSIRDVLLVRDYTPGVFLNLSGRPASRPPGLVQDLQVGSEVE